MRLIIRQYLSLLKESQELDAILPNLLLSLGVEPIISPQVGVRQNGVDIAAVGSVDKGPKTLFLFVVKRGDLGRAEWDSGPQSVRQTLNEIRDVFLQSATAKKYAELPKAIILCTGGQLKQEVETAWHGYIEEHRLKEEVEYHFWGGDQLAPMIEKNLLREHLLPEQFQSKFRKVLALLGDTDYTLDDYYEVLEEIITKGDFSGKTKSTVGKKVIKALRTLHLCQSIVHVWAINEDNLKPAVLCAERTLLNAWELIRRNDLISQQAVTREFTNIHSGLLNVYVNYFKKFEPHCYVEDGLIGYGEHFIQDSVNVFEQLGFLNATALLNMHYLSGEQSDETVHQNCGQIAKAIEALILNHSATNVPCYDGHIIEIAMAILILASFGRSQTVKGWISRITDQSMFAYHVMGRHFPIQTDSFDDLVALNITGEIEKERLFELSTLFAILAEWCVVLGLEEEYQHIRREMTSEKLKCTLQIWYPDAETDEHLYMNQAAYDTGAVYAPMELLPEASQMKERIIAVQARTIKPESISSIRHGLRYLPAIASRHFRTPILPLYWQFGVVADADRDQKDQSTTSEQESKDAQT